MKRRKSAERCSIGTNRRRLLMSQQLPPTTWDEDPANDEVLAQRLEQLDSIRMQRATGGRLTWENGQIVRTQPLPSQRRKAQLYPAVTAHGDNAVSAVMTKESVLLQPTVWVDASVVAQEAALEPVQ